MLRRPSDYWRQKNDARTISRRKREVVASFIAVAVAASLEVYSLSNAATTTSPAPPAAILADKIAIAIAVAIIVRWINHYMDDKVPKDDVYASSRAEVLEHIRNARERVWVAQNWFQEQESHAAVILSACVPADNLRIIFASLRHDLDVEGWHSPIYARRKGRGLSVADIKSYVRHSARLIAEAGKSDSLRFNFGHSPGWIVIADVHVFWGPTPVNDSNWGSDLYFHKDTVAGAWGQFWTKQFEYIWNKTAHDLKTEVEWNEQLRFDVPPK